MPWISNATNSSRSARCAALACRSAVSAEITMSPSRCGESDANDPSRIGNERTSVVVAFPRYCRFRRVMARSPTSTNPHSASLTPALARVVCPTFFRKLVSSLIFLCRFVTCITIRSPSADRLLKGEPRILHPAVVDPAQDPNKALLDEAKLAEGQLTFSEQIGRASC